MTKMRNLIQFGLIISFSVAAITMAQNAVGKQRSNQDSIQYSIASRQVWAARDNGSDMVNVKVGLLIPRGMPQVEKKFGYATSAGAVSVALDRVAREGLLTRVEWRFNVGFSQCDEATAVGELIKLITEDKVNVIVGPPCTIAAVPTAVLAKFYDIPMFSWASTSVLLAEARYTTLVRVISSGLRLGRALRELLQYFNWQRFGMVFTDDRAARVCYSIAEGVRKAIARAAVVNVHNMAIDSPSISDGEIEMFLTGLSKYARVAIVCLELEDDNRRFMLRAQQLEMTGHEYVYIMPDYVRDMSRSELWKQFTPEADHDDRDAEAKLAFKPCFFMEAKLSSHKELHYFKKQIIGRIEDYPFHHVFERDVDEQYGSLYSPFLHDSIYLYALALNKTLELGGNITTGTLIANTTRGMQFFGKSGHVVIDQFGGREPNFEIRGFDREMKLTAFAKALMYKHDGDTIHLLMPERMIWDSRGGFVPVDMPNCGIDGGLCFRKMDKNVLTYMTMGVTTAMLIVAIGCILLISYTRRNMMEQEMAKMHWKIPLREVTFVNDKSSSTSLGSADTISTQLSEDTQDAIAKGHKNVALYKTALCWVKQHNRSIVLSSQEDHAHMKAMRDVAHVNLNLFHGLMLDGPKVSSVWKYLSKGSLTDVLQNDTYKLDWFFKFSLIKDLANGMEHMHASPLGSMGRLKSSNCVIDQSWVLKITDYGLNSIRTNKKEAKEKLWSAPEHLRTLDPPVNGSLEGDVYSFAIVIQEILARDRPFCHNDLLPADCILRVAKCESPPFRPTIAFNDSNEADPAVIQLMNDCWTEDPSLRPTFRSIKTQLRTIGRGRKINLMDHALKMMEKYTQGLEQTIDDRNKEMLDEIKKADDIVYQLLPRSTADKMKSGQPVEAERYDTCTVLMVEIGNIEELISGSSALQAVEVLNKVQQYINETVAQFDAYRVESLGNKTTIISGVPDRNGNRHAQILADLALHLIADCCEGSVACNQTSKKLNIRAALHSGPVTTAVVGNTIPRFCVLGTTLDIAERLEETGKSLCIHMSEATHSLLMDLGGGYVCKPRGEIVIKGQGTMFTYWLLAKSANTIFDNTSDRTSGRSVARIRKVCKKADTMADGSKQNPVSAQKIGEK